MADLYQPLQPAAQLREQVYESLEELILDGRLRAGQRLVESDLATQLGVSRGPIREALQHLERDGWLEVRPRQGTYVREPQEEDLEDYFWARTLLEVETAGRAARRVAADPEGTREGIERLRALIDASQKMVPGLTEKAEAEMSAEMAELRRRYRANSRRFHYSIGQLAGSQALVELLQYLGKRTRWYFASIAYHSQLNEHGELLAAIEQGDEARARALMREHIDDLSAMSLEDMRGRRSAAAPLS
jgi:DNA-binding GntR family transcriptional regulator